MKGFEEIIEPDERQKLFTISLSELHGELNNITIESSAPSRVREHFDTAKNLSLYSWFVYEFHPIALLTGFQALELALRIRAENENTTLAKRNLRSIMNYAVAEGWITEDGISGRRHIARARLQDRKVREAIERARHTGIESEAVEEPTDDEIMAEARAMNIVKSVCDAAISLRNALAHGETILSPNSHRRLTTTADLINQLFQ